MKVKIVGKRSGNFTDRTTGEMVSFGKMSVVTPFPNKKQLQTFVQTDELRDLYNSYELIERLNRTGFAPKLPDNSTNVTLISVKGKR